MHLTPKDLSPDQLEAYNSILRWVADKNRKQVLTMGGFAGTGKSTLTSVFARSCGLNPIAFATFTGKASQVLRRKLDEASAIAPNSYIGTLHGLIYEPITDEKTGAVLGWSKRQELDQKFKLIVVDEASMVPESLLADLKSYGVPVLAIGDHGQLPPVNGTSNLMERPDLRLERIHRQALGNPIINLSALVRETGKLDRRFADGEAVQFRNQSEMRDLIERRCAGASQERLNEIASLCYTNATRVRINRLSRECRGAKSRAPILGDQTICLKNVRNDPEPPIFNGMRGFITSEPALSEDGHHVTCRVEFPDDKVKVDAAVLCAHQFDRPKTFKSFEELAECKLNVGSWHAAGMLFDHGFGLTVHKSQGSQFSDVLFVHERPFRMDEDEYRRFVYTAITRAAEKLTVLV